MNKHIFSILKQTLAAKVKRKMQYTEDLMVTHMKSVKKKNNTSATPKLFAIVKKVLKSNHSDM